VTRLVGILSPRVTFLKMLKLQHRNNLSSESRPLGSVGQLTLKAQGSVQMMSLIGPFVLQGGWY
jgi:hypothetical protein